MAIHCNYHVLDFKTRLLGSSARFDVGNNHSPVLRQTETRCERRRYLLRTSPNYGSVNAPVFPQLLIHESNGVCWYSEPQSFAAPAFSQNKRVQPQHVTIEIYKRPTAAPRIDRSVGLQVDHGSFGIGLPPRRTDDA